MVRFCVAAALVLVASVAGAAGESCDELKRKADRAERRWERSCTVPTPGPILTATPAPTLAPDCSDGTFAYDSAGQMLTRLRRTYEPGRIYNLCMTVPADAVAPSGSLNLYSVNHGNASCGIHHLWVTSPSGRSQQTSGSAPAINPPFERGKWSVLVMLEPNPLTLCAENKGLSMYARWF